MTKRIVAFSAIILLLVVIGYTLAIASSASTTVKGKCMTCHKETSPGLYMQWRTSEHADHNITCYDCHSADRNDEDAFLHEGAYIATLVTPNDCGQCHEREAEEASHSYHAKAGQILESADAYLAHAAGGAPIAIVGCESCHGGVVEIDPSSPNRLSSTSWPNSGIGRINPDGSLGSCSACHSRHSFSVSQVRQPENCGKCHLGPDHPQKEIYEESKHGINYRANVNGMNLDADRWVVGQDYYAAPTCATCHMSATRNTAITHDVGDRISWTLRPPVSKHKDNWRQKRENMQDVCSACHGQVFVDGHYRQFDGVVNLYNEKFAKPATEAIGIVKRNGSLEHPAAFSNDLEWSYWELWHHEGRRARHGASMMGPDYAWWHGIYDVAHNFYFDFIPDVRETGDTEAIRYIDNLLQNDPMHQWMTRPTADIKSDIKSGAMQEVYESFFQPELE
ncbi:MAG: multiheme c-type cytochrome [Candidatus Electryoneaceae bacterium]|nr:multiheme c-type cytochrome [Candidatus Electryoneaceae bacterium]